MYRKTTVVTVWIAAMVVAGCSKPDDAPENSPVLLTPKVKRVAKDGGTWVGTVGAVGPDWFELAAGWEGSKDSVTGKPRWDVKLSEKPKRISTRGTVVGGDPDGEPAQFSQRDTHMATDLKVGDRVLVRWCGDNREEWSTDIEILRRPGGKIPPLGMDQWGMRSTLVEEHQAYQDWEEKGTPIPAKYLNREGRTYTGDRAWTNPPYPQVAPQPREVVTKP